MILSEVKFKTADPTFSIHDENLCSDFGVRTVRFAIVRNLVARPGLKREATSILQLRVQFPFDTEKNVAFGAPVVRQVAGGVFDHAHADGAELPGPPIGGPAFALMFNPFDGSPVCDAERDLRNIHGWQISCRIFVSVFEKLIS